MAGWIKISLGTEVGLGPDNSVSETVRWGSTPTPTPKKGHSSAYHNRKSTGYSPACICYRLGGYELSESFLAVRCVDIMQFKAWVPTCCSRCDYLWLTSPFATKQGGTMEKSMIRWSAPDTSTAVEILARYPSTWFRIYARRPQRVSVLRAVRDCCRILSTLCSFKL